jgi:8-oxo-dGTP diphosphatase
MTIKEYLNTNPKPVREVIGFLVKEDRVILGLRKQVSLGLGDQLISGIGGKVGDNPGLEKESYSEAIVREIKEETGVTITKFHECGEITFLFPAKPKWDQFVKIYIIEDWQGEPIEAEKIQPISFAINDLPFTKMWADNQYWVPKVLNGEHITATILYNDDNCTVGETLVTVINSTK